MIGQQPDIDWKVSCQQTVTVMQKEPRAPHPLSYLCSPNRANWPPVFFLLSHDDHSWKLRFLRQLCHRPSFPALGTSKAGRAFPRLTGQGLAHPPYPFTPGICVVSTPEPLLANPDFPEHGGYMGSACSRHGHLGTWGREQQGLSLIKKIPAWRDFHPQGLIKPYSVSLLTAGLQVYIPLGQTLERGRKSTGFQTPKLPPNS